VQFHRPPSASTFPYSFTGLVFLHLFRSNFSLILINPRTSCTSKTCLFPRNISLPTHHPSVLIGHHPTCSSTKSNSLDPSPTNAQRPTRRSHTLQCNTSAELGWGYHAKRDNAADKGEIRVVWLMCARWSVRRVDKFDKAFSSCKSSARFSVIMMVRVHTIGLVQRICDVPIPSSRLLLRGARLALNRGCTRLLSLSNRSSTSLHQYPHYVRLRIHTRTGPHSPSTSTLMPPQSPIP
jgi:hypothetical protein